MTGKKKPNGYWTKERSSDEALKYQSRSEFKKMSRSAFASAQKHGWLDEICSHMQLKKRSNGYWTKELCAHEALRYTSRTNFQVGSNSAYSRSHKEGWLDEICHHMPTNKLIKEFVTKDTCAVQALKYQSRSEFKREYFNAYKVARINGWLDDVCRHMTSRGGWDKKNCAEAALKYESKKAFRGGCLAAYNYASKKGWLDDICMHMEATRKPRAFWSKEICRDEALKYNTRSEFEKRSKAAYFKARENAWLDEVCSHMEMEVRKKPSGFWTKEQCIKEALKYQTRTEFLKNCESAHSKARKNGWLDEVCSHMVSLIKPSGYWNQERCASEALNYSTRLNFQKESEAAYSAARKNRWLNTICSHMVEFSKPNGYWTKDRCLEEAKKYETRTDFITGCNGAYKVASKEGWLDEIFAHMVPIGHMYLRGLYLIVNKRLNMAYIGLTSNFERRKQEHLKGKGNRTNSTEIINEEDTEFIPLTDYVSVEQAADLELKFVDEYEKQGYLLLNDKSRIGGLGGSSLKWTEELCREEALKYQTRYDFQKGNRKAHAAAQRQGILEQICVHMIVPKRQIYWTKERLAKEALKYQTRAAFSKGSGSAYGTVRKNGWLDEICSHMVLQLKSAGHWDKELCAAEALKYQRRSYFKKACGSAYNSARQNDWLEEICAHMLK
ncbi:GIY-YIG nuclease family protein [Shewanella putrefaciens]|uniref:GIY-YIG nuclease family protein n=1 Tax=Shewanella putrefaciens TaxID=24 RepID=UPI0018E6ECC1|nr:GIY-YIG nuclease family protein [Shewanella putrefaciens]